MSDSEHMRRALRVAASADGFVSPRPAVGCVIVDRAGRFVSDGGTEPAPGRHAEVVALDAAGPRARGGTAYVTLEPCSHNSVTGPCAHALVSAGVARVIAACRDPNPLVRGRGLSLLRRSGVEVRIGVLRAQARARIESFEKWVLTGRPFVTLKLASTLDGKLAAPDGTSRWITGSEARRDVHEMRERVDAVLVGAGTAVADDPALTVRPEATARRQPARVLVDSSGRTPPTARLFAPGARVIVLTTSRAPAARRDEWEAAGASVLVVDAAEGGIDLHAGLRALGTQGFCNVLAETGPTLCAALVAEGLADRLVVYQAPKLVGGDAPGMLASGVKTIAEAWPLTIERIRRVGDDLRLDLRPVR